MQELLLLVQAQASTIDELQTKLVNNSPRPHGMEVEEGWNNADVFEQLQEQLLVNAKLSSLNAELVQKLDLVVLKVSASVWVCSKLI